MGLFIVAAIAPILVPQFGDRFPYWQERLVASNLPQFIWSFGNFDGVHYLGIAKDGYAYQFTQAFFPLYPLLIKLVSYLTFGQILIAALVISNLAFLAGLLIASKLISQIYDQKTAFWSCLFLLAFPTSYYFGAVYTEGLFFAIVIASFYLLQKGKTWQVAILGSLGCATRLIGLALMPASFFSKNLKIRLPLFLIPLGFLAYVAYLAIEFDNPFYFATSQEIFGQERSVTAPVLLPQVIWRYLKIISTVNGLPLFNAIFELFSTILAAVLLIFAYKKVKIEWLIFATLAVLVPTLTGTLASMPRYVLLAFPIYIVLAKIESLKIKVLILSIFLILLSITTTLFTRGYWVA